MNWQQYGKKVALRLDQLQNVGSFTEEDGKSKTMRLAVGRSGEMKRGNAVALYLLIDESDGVIADAKFQAFGGSALLAAADAACSLLIGKNYDQASRLTADLIDRELRAKGEENAFPSEAASALNQIIEAIDAACQQCTDIPFADTYVAPPIGQEHFQGEAQEYPGWKQLTTAQKISVIEQVIAKEIQPYIELDAGGVKVLNLIEDRELVIAYEGNCTSCHSATGSTLNAIQQILRTKVSPDLIVTPDLSFLNHNPTF